MSSNIEIISLLGILAIIAGGFFIFRKKENTNLTLPLRLQAAERMILYLERIKPQNLLTRLDSTNLNPLELQSLVLSEIKKELDHNLAQQLYLSSATWQKIVLASNTTSAAIIQGLNAVNGTTKELLVHVLSNPDSTSLGLIDQAIEAIKEESRRNF